MKRLAAALAAALIAAAPAWAACRMDYHCKGINGVSTPYGSSPSLPPQSGYQCYETCDDCRSEMSASMSQVNQAMGQVRQSGAQVGNFSDYCSMSSCYESDCTPGEGSSGDGQQDAIRAMDHWARQFAAKAYQAGRQAEREREDQAKAQAARIQRAEDNINARYGAGAGSAQNPGSFGNALNSRPVDGPRIGGGTVGDLSGDVEKDTISETYISGGKPVSVPVPKPQANVAAGGMDGGKSPMVSFNLPGGYGDVSVDEIEGGVKIGGEVAVKSEDGSSLKMGDAVGIKGKGDSSGGSVPEAFGEGGFEGSAKTPDGGAVKGGVNGETGEDPKAHLGGETTVAESPIGSAKINTETDEEGKTSIGGEIAAGPQLPSGTKVGGVEVEGQVGVTAWAKATGHVNIDTDKMRNDVDEAAFNAHVWWNSQSWHQ